jgi:hypothetical protein
VGFANYSHDQPVRSPDWTVREIAGTVDAHAVNVTIGHEVGKRRPYAGFIVERGSAACSSTTATPP